MPHEKLKVAMCVLLARTVLEGVCDDNVGLVRFLQDGAVRRTEEHHERLGAFDGRVLDVVHNGQAAGLDGDGEELLKLELLISVALRAVVRTPLRETVPRTSFNFLLLKILMDSIWLPFSLKIFSSV